MDRGRGCLLDGRHLLVCLREALLQQESEGKASFWFLCVRYVWWRFATAIAIAFGEQDIYVVSHHVCVGDRRSGCSSFTKRLEVRGMGGS